jgi:hypothetical protein
VNWFLIWYGRGIKDFLDIMQFISVERIFSRLVKDYMLSRIEVLSYITRSMSFYFLENKIIFIFFVSMNEEFDTLVDEKQKRNHSFLSFFYGGFECISSESRKTSQKLVSLHNILV